MSAILDLCDRWDALSKGETATTKAIREAYAVELAERPCGQRSVRVIATTLEAGGYITQACIVPKAERHTEHRDADGATWIESVR